ncbi:peroxisomal N(1)-acetyl-spermine/spermidine oxidase isoform X2 [Scyliorhinus canicula]|uniref:peroxisomal N(1)-acetyl-spermine/spermidine oxidase isoform X2 n=1 Tax=Scyliorhinus canicula TaxID=7830 RepID=UPI0018F356E7|nr:peroxisomal N(1)-acetyl-spermine/spermidine oxidase isoform X2 [Scyliorhinus canicula]
MAPSVVIVGCGIAGLAAAGRLLQGGFPGRLRLLEAGDRSGGRAWSREFAEGLVEAGAQWIHGPSKQNAVFQLASQYDLLDEEAMSEENQAVQMDRLPPDVSTYYTSSGKRLGSEITAPVEELYSALYLKSREFFHSKTEPAHSLGEFLKHEIARCAEEWKDDVETCNLKLALLNGEFKLDCCISGTDSLDLVALQPFGEYVSLPGIDCVFPGGFKSLIDAMMKSLPKDIVSYNKPVKCIHWNGSFKTSETQEHSYPVLVECEDGETIPADHVIVTVSLGFLKEHYQTFIRPPLPDSKINSIQKLGFGTNSKIFLEFEKPFWEPECQLIRLVWEDESPLLSKRPDLQKEWFRKIFGFIVLQPMERHGHVLLAVLAGEEANFMESLSDSEVKNCLTQVLRRFTGNPLIPQPKDIIRSKWYSDQYTKGSYTYTAVGSSGDDIDAIAQPLPLASTKAQPLQVLFAGEATHRAFYSTTHGALESGWREADRLNDHYLPFSSMNAKL